MENRIYGIITIAIAILLYSLAFKKYKSEKYNLSVGFIVLAGLILRLYTSMDFFLHEWDERYHALVAKNLLQNPFKPMLYVNPLIDYDYKNWTANHIWVHKQPVPLYSMAASMLLLGKSTIALRMPSIILSTISILATFKIGKILQSSKVGIIAAFLFSINGLIIEQTAGRVATDHVDVFFFSLVTLSIYFLLRSTRNRSKLSFIFGSILVAFAILTKWLPALIVIPIWLVFSYKEFNTRQIICYLLVFGSIVCAIVIPWQVFITSSFPLEAAWEYEYNKKHIFETLEAERSSFFYHFDRMRMIFGEIVYIPLIWLMYNATKQLSRDVLSKQIIAIWILVPYIFFSFVATKMQGYILFTSAAIFIMIAMFFEYVESTNFKYNKLKNVLLISLLVLPIRYSLERIKPFSIRERNPEWIRKMQEIESHKQGERAVVFNTRFPIETMFHTDMVAYEAIPDKQTLDGIRLKGYEIYIDNCSELDPKLMSLEFVNYVEVTGRNEDRK